MRLLRGSILGSQNLIYVGGPYYFDPSNLSFTNADPSSVAGQLSGCTVTTLLNGNVFTTGAGFNTGSILNAQAKDWIPPTTLLYRFRDRHSEELLRPYGCKMVKCSWSARSLIPRCHSCSLPQCRSFRLRGLRRRLRRRFCCKMDGCSLWAEKIRRATPLQPPPRHTSREIPALSPEWVFHSGMQSLCSKRFAVNRSRAARGR